MKSLFGTHKGKDVFKLTLKNSKGHEVSVINFGTIITNYLVPDKSGKPRDIVLGFDTLEPYIINPSYFGATIGRFANRIGGASFSIDGKTCTLAANDGRNSLHSGIEGFDKRVWDIVSESENAVSFHYLSADGEEGFPGNCSADVTMTLNDNSLVIEYSATTDKPTHVNLTNHSYFNLNGSGSGSVEGHLFTIHSDRITENDSESIPTGKILQLAGDFFDLKSKTTLSEKLEKYPGMDFDHNYILGGGYAKAAEAFSEESGIGLALFTDQPGVQFYSGKYLDGLKGKGGCSYNKHDGFCFEPQLWPDAPNRPDFPSSLLKPGEKYVQKSAFVITN